MDIEGKDYLVWLHEIRKKNWEERKKSGLSNVEWIRKTTQEAEKILGRKIPKIKKNLLFLIVVIGL